MRSGSADDKPQTGTAFEQRLATGLPLNRKERFYTGTVLPAIVAGDGFSHLHLLLRRCGLDLDPLGEAVVGTLDEGPDIQFFTEFSFGESVFTAEDRRRFAGWEEELEAKHVPDLVVLGSDWLLAIEAKMFHRPTAQSLKAQMNKQRGLVDYLADKLAVTPDRVRHVLLLPKGLADDRTSLRDVVTWEAVLDDYASVAPAYWMDVLRVALDRYAQLASPEPTFGSNADAALAGEEIYATGGTEFAWMGRRGGLQGAGLATDLSSGAWRQRAYEVRVEPLPGNGNWFAVSEFLKKVEALEHQPGPQPSKPSM